MAVEAEKLGQVAAVQCHQVRDRAVAGLVVEDKQLTTLVKQEHLARVIAVAMLIQVRDQQGEVAQVQLVAVLQL